MTFVETVKGILSVVIPKEYIAKEGVAGGNGSGGEKEAVYGRFNRAVELGQLGEQRDVGLN